MIKITKRSIEAIAPTGKDHFVWDNKLSGFDILVSPQGLKTYIIQYRFRGKTQRVKLGRFDLMTTDEARRDAKITLDDVEAGKNPAKSVGQKRSSPNLNKIGARFLDEYVAVRLKPGTQANYQQVLRAYVLPVLGTRKDGRRARRNVRKDRLCLQRHYGHADGFSKPDWRYGFNPVRRSKAAGFVGEGPLP